MLSYNYAHLCLPKNASKIDLENLNIKTALRRFGVGTLARMFETSVQSILLDKLGICVPHTKKLFDLISSNDHDVAIVYLNENKSNTENLYFESIVFDHSNVCNKDGPKLRYPNLINSRGEEENLQLGKYILVIIMKIFFNCN